jgi:hypothetical protein
MNRKTENYGDDPFNDRRKSFYSIDIKLQDPDEFKNLLSRKEYHEAYGALRNLAELIVIRADRDIPIYASFNIQNLKENT